MAKTRYIYCVHCQGHVDARLTNGKEIYPGLYALRKSAFYICDSCKNYVGCHKGRDHRPLGCIPTPELRHARKLIHELMDPLWQQGLARRSEIYAALSKLIGREYHTAELRSVDEARVVYRFLQRFRRARIFFRNKAGKRRI